MQRSVPILALFGLAGLALTGARAEAQPPPPPPPPPPPVAHDVQEGRTLSGHRFVPFRTVVYPFITWRVGTDTEAAFSRLEVDVQDPRDPEGPPIGTLDGKLAIVTEGFQLSARVFPWLGLRVKLVAGVASGLDRDGAIEVGANGTYGFETGAALRIFQTRRAQLTFDFSESIVNIQGLKPRLLLDSIPEQGEPIVVPELRLTYAGRAVRSAPSLSLGLALAPWLGVQASGTYARRRVKTSVSDDREDLIEGGLGLSLLPGPVSLMLGGRVTHELRSGDERAPAAALEPQDSTRGEVEAAIFYMGRPELDLGLRFTRLIGKSDARVLGGLTLAYYW